MQSTDHPSRAADRNALARTMRASAGRRHSPERGGPARFVLVVAVVAVAGACASPGRDAAGPASESTAAASPQDAFWSTLQAHCGRAYAGRVVFDEGGDGGFDGERLVMHVRECSDARLAIPFHVGEDRSRTWLLTRTAEGLRLKHDHRHEDGVEDEITQYGGDTRNPGGATRQEFHADALTARLLPAAATNVWTMEVESGRFVYALRREGTPRRFRAEFDLSKPVETPPAPWGHD